MSNFTPGQEKAIKILEKNLSVSAGAGSGKTQVLVERFLYIIEAGKAPADKILAITFTRKAAKEMRERVRQGLRERSDSTKQNSHFWQEQLRLAAKAQISTIDSLCSRILRENPIEANLDPAFMTAEEFELAEFRTKEIRNFMAAELKNAGAAFLALLDEYGLKLLQDMFMSLSEDLPAIIREKDLAAPYRRYLTEDVPCLQEQLREQVKQLVTYADSITGVHGQELQALAGNLPQVFAALDECRAEVLEQYLGSLTARNKLDSELVKSVREKSEALCRVQHEKQALALIVDWQTELGALADWLDKSQNKANLLSFADIAERAYRLLSTEPRILEKYRLRFPYIMVDEFQDTNELQRNLIYLLAGGKADLLCGERLFVVGDPKQSIYRFRGADVSVFTAVRKDIQSSGGENIELVDNFRSTKPILELANTVFSDLMGADNSEGVFYEALRPTIDEGKLPQFIIVEAESNNRSGAVNIEAEVIAEEIERLAQQESLAYADMAILVSAINQAPRFRKALAKRAIEAEIVDGKGFFERQEVIDLMNVLTFLENQHRDIELAGVLRSPYCGIADNVLTELFLAREDGESLWSVLRKKEDLTKMPLLLRAVNILNKLLNVVKLQGLPELFDKIIGEFSLAPLIAAQTYGIEQWNNVQRLRQLAVDAAMQQGISLRDFLARISLMRAAGTRFAAARSGNKDAVTIMTIHKAKGLEFPAVFVPSLHAKGRNDAAPLIYLNNLGLGIKVAGENGSLADTAVYLKLKDLNKALNEQEKKRQLYVAVTRAERFLTISGIAAAGGSKKTEDATWMDALLRILDPAAVKKVVEIKHIQAETYNCQSCETQAKIPAAVAEELYGSVQPLPAYGVKGPYVFSATSLEFAENCPRSYYYRYIAQLPQTELALPSEEAAGEKAAVPANILGLVVHETMSNLETFGMQEAFAQALAGCAPHLRENLRTKAEPLLTKYLQSPLYKKIEGLPQQAEVGFSLSLFNHAGRPVYLRGSIDCLLTLPDGQLGIVDYKTGRPPQKREEISGYLLQIALYALIAEKLTGKKVAYAELHFLQDCSSWPALLDAEAILAELEEKCGELLDKKEEQDFAVRLSSCSLCNFAYLCPRK